MVAFKTLILSVAAVATASNIGRRAETADPYAGLTCSGCSALPAPATACNANSCYRAFFNARNGSSGKHCPSEAFSFCCNWNSFDAASKSLFVTSSALTSYAPWTTNCQGAEDTSEDVIKKINDVCACTLNHQILLETTNAYYGLVGKPVGDPACH